MSPRLLLTCSLCALLLSASSSYASQLDGVLRDWITRNIALERTADGRDVLLLRKAPIRAYIRIADPDIESEARTAIANFADALEISYEFTSTNINMVVAIADRIADESGKPSMDLLRSFGLTGDNTDVVTDNDWSPGCGYYGSRDLVERFLIFSIVAGRKDFTKQRLKSCVMTGIIMGFGLRIQERRLIESADGYLQFLLLGRSSKECDDEVTATGQLSTSESLIDCVYKKMRSKFH